MTGFDFYVGACLGILAINALRQIFDYWVSHDWYWVSKLRK
jgi:hypothetical protein